MSVISVWPTLGAFREIAGERPHDQLMAFSLLKAAMIIVATLSGVLLAFFLNLPECHMFVKWTCASTARVIEGPVGRGVSSSLFLIRIKCIV